MLEITMYETVYAPWKEGDDERERISEDEQNYRFDTARELADWLRMGGYQRTSKSAPFSERTWLTDVDPYEHPYTGVLYEYSVHLLRGSERLWAAVCASVSWDKVVGP